ncbi:MAG: anaerobic ribonucleoside-triphosphate reductase activating protein [Ruminococcaceae bacterium]|nr:anaerobic ribonucleoside-triphosphate reductase activating protein [Oscillospiraceae bacterium]
MKICGLQKLTALDFPGRIACTVFTPGCNFRCGFCHNAALVTAGEMPEDIDLEEIFSYLRKRRGILDGVVLTGGEPLMQDGLSDFLREVKAMGYLAKLDTNGSFPEKLEELLNENLVDYVAMDIKNSPEKYTKSCGVKLLDWSKIEKSIELIIKCAPDYEFRTTAVAQLHSDEDFRAMGGLIKGARNWYIQKFVDSGALIGSGFSAPADADLRRWAEIASSFAEKVGIRGI